MARPPIFLPLVGALVLACQAAPEPSKSQVQPDSSASKAGPQPGTQPSSAPVQAAPSGPVSEPPPAAPNPAPAWFDANAYEHAAIVRQDLTGSRLSSGQLSAMILLELKPGTTAEQCIEMARSKLGDAIPNLPATTTTPQGYLQVQGKHQSYEYTAVCGVAKDKPTMFLSYTQ